MQGTLTAIGATPLSAIPRDAATALRSDAAQAAQVASLRAANRTSSPSLAEGPITEAHGEALRAAILREGTVPRAALALGWPHRRGTWVAEKFALKSDPRALEDARREGGTRRYLIPSAILQRSGAWLAVFRRHGGNRNIYAATRAADAAMVAALEAAL